MSTTTRAARPAAACPLRPGEPCTLCQVDVTGPQDCGLVWLVMGDDELREGVHRSRLATLDARPRPARAAADGDSGPDPVSRPGPAPAVARPSPAGS